MSRQIYTYTDLAKLSESNLFAEIRYYPQVTVSSDLRKGLKGRMSVDRVKGILSGDEKVRVTDFGTLSSLIEKEWNSNQSKFHQMVLLSEYIRNKMEMEGEDKKQKNWLLGCLRNIANIRFSIILLEQAQVRPEDLEPEEDKNLQLLKQSWEYLEKEDPEISKFRDRMEDLKNRNAWEPILKKAFALSDTSGIKKVVFHGFYYITPYQERIMQLLEEAGFELIFLFPYDKRYPFVYEIWKQTYSVEHGYPSMTEWHMEVSDGSDAYGEIFEGRKSIPQNNLSIQEYDSMMGFIDDILQIRQEGYTVYSADDTSINKILQEYFPEEYGERKLLSYPIGQFVSVLNQLWDEEEEQIKLEDRQLIELFASGWLTYQGIPGRQYLQDLLHILPFFKGCHTRKEWTERMEMYEEIQTKILKKFENERDENPAVARWQKILENPFGDFSQFAVSEKKLRVLFELILQIFQMAEALFCDNEPILVQQHIEKLDRILKSYQISSELYEEERELVEDIFGELEKPGSFSMKCYPSDIAKALNLYICGKFEDGEIEKHQVGLVSALCFVDAACIKNQGKVHICMCDRENLPGGKKEYSWPMTSRLVRDLKKRTENPLLENLISVTESSILCNRYFIYSALKNKEVQLSWVSCVDGEPKEASAYIRLLCEMTGKKVISSEGGKCTVQQVQELNGETDRIRNYRKQKMPVYTIKEAKMDYALCPMRYVLGYVMERHPVYETEFQQTYAINALIASI